MNLDFLASRPQLRAARRGTSPARRGIPARFEALEGRCLMAINIFEFAASMSAALPVMIAPGSGLPLYVTEAGRNKIAIVDPSTLAVSQEIDIPTANSAPIGIADGPDGKIWFTETLGNKIASLDKSTGTVQEFSLPSADSAPVGIAAGPDGKVWFTEVGGNQIGVIDPSTHAIQEFPLPSSNSVPVQITAGSDGKLWFTETYNDVIGSIDPTTHVIQEFDTPGGHSPFGITAGPGNKLWFTEPGPGVVASIDPISKAFETFSVPTHNSEPTGIAVGPDGNLWFSETLGNAIGTMDQTTHAITEYGVPTVLSAPVGITSGDNGNLYFAEAFGGKIGRVTLAAPAGAIAPIIPLGSALQPAIDDALLPSAGGGLYGIVGGPDGSLWFTESIDGKIGTIDPVTHVITRFDVPTENSRPLGITSLGGKLWFTEGANKIGSIDPSTHAFAEYAIPTASSGPVGIAADPDGKLWFTESFVGKLGVFDPVTHVFQEFSLPSSHSAPLGIVTGPDGNLWFTELSSGKIGQINRTTHAIQEFNIPSSDNGPWTIVSGPGGKLWFTEASGERLGSIDPTTHAIAEYDLPGGFHLPLGLTVGSNGLLWFTEALGNSIGSFDPSTQTFDTTSVPTSLSGPAQITTGSDGNLWFTEFLAGNVGLAQLHAFPDTVALTRSTDSAEIGTPVTFTATVTPGVAGALNGHVVFKVDGAALATVPVSVVGGTYQASFTTSSLAAGMHSVMAFYEGDSAFQDNQSNTVTVNVVPQTVTDGPTVTEVQRFGVHAQPTTLVATFDRPLDATTSQDTKNYLLVAPGGHRIRIRRAHYDAATHTVTLSLGRRLPLSMVFHLTIIGTAPGGVRDVNGLLLDGANTGKPGSDYVTTISRHNLQRPTLTHHLARSRHRR